MGMVMTEVSFAAARFTAIVPATAPATFVKVPVTKCQRVGGM